jgi:DNA-directed RNA polymerase specialized sigma24 family protein
MQAKDLQRELYNHSLEEIADMLEVSLEQVLQIKADT